MSSCQLGENICFLDKQNYITTYSELLQKNQVCSKNRTLVLFGNSQCDSDKNLFFFLKRHVISKKRILQSKINAWDMNLFSMLQQFVAC